MKEIKISKKNIISNSRDINELEEFSSGLESIIYLYKDSKYYDRNVLLKYFRSLKHFVEYNINFTVDIMENKRKKIELISNMKCFKDEIKILDAAYEFGEFKGYTMEICPYRVINPYADTRIVIKYLKIIKEKIELLNKNDIYIGDFNPTNFLVDINDNNISMCDLDNLKIKDLDFDIKHRFVRNFMENCNKIENIDSYCFNLFTISMLTKYRNSYVLDNLSEKLLPIELNNKKNKEIIESMINLDNNYEKKYLLDNLN